MPHNLEQHTTKPTQTETDLDLSRTYIEEQIIQLESQFSQPEQSTPKLIDLTSEQITAQLNADILAIDTTISPEMRETLRKSTHRKPGGPKELWSSNQWR